MNITLEEQIEFMSGLVTTYEKWAVEAPVSYWASHFQHFKAILATLESVKASREAVVPYQSEDK